MATYLIVQSWVAAVVAIVLGGYAGYEYACAKKADETIQELKNPESEEENEEEEEAERAWAEQQKREQIAELKEQRCAFARRTKISIIAAGLCMAFFAIVQYVLNYSNFTLALVALDAFFVSVVYVWNCDYDETAATAFVCLTFTVAVIGVGIGLTLTFDTALPTEPQTYTETNDAGETWRWAPEENSEMEPESGEPAVDLDEKMYYDFTLVPDEQKHFYDATLDANVAVEVVGHKVKYTLTRYHQYYGERVVKVWCARPNPIWDDEDALTTMYIQFDFAPKGRKDSWLLQNAYTYHTKLRTGTLVYRLQPIDAPALELDADMMVLIDAALDGKMQWKHTECKLYMDESGTIDLSALIESYGYRFAGFDPVRPRGIETAEDVADSRWMVYTNGYSAIRLLDDASGLIFWLMCDSGGEWNMDLVPIMVPDDFSTTVKVRGMEFQTYDWLVATLVQYLELANVTFYEFPEDGAAVSIDFYADYGVKPPVIGEAA